jgi:hypothetical protein
MFAPDKAAVDQSQERPTVGLTAGSRTSNVDLPVAGSREYGTGRRDLAWDASPLAAREGGPV